MTTTSQFDFEAIKLSHVAITMDGNGRWAQKRGLPRIAGHKRGAKVAEELVSKCAEHGLPILTLFAFSYENWQRDKEEVDYILLNLLPEMVRRFRKKANKSNIRIRVIGDIERLPDYVKADLADTENSTASNSGMIVNLALSYSGRREIVHTIKSIARGISAGEYQIEDIDESLVEKYLYTADLPDPDLHIRCGCVSRLSNFLLWQMAYTEQFPLEVLWPDFTFEDMQKAIMFYHCQPRKFGKVEPSDNAIS